MSVVVAGAVVLGLMQLGVPVASAASSSQVSSTVAKAETRRSTPDVLASAVLLSSAYDQISYDRSFRIGCTALSSAQFFGRVREDFVGLFPISLARPLSLGVDMDLRPIKPAAFNVHVQTLVSNGWTFSTRPGHPHYPGYIAFRLRIRSR